MSATPDDLQSRVETVSHASDQWRHELAQLGGRNALLWHKDTPLGMFDLTIAHPSGVAKLLTGGRTLLSELVREQIALREARTRIASIHAKTVELREGHGVETCFVAIGMASWHLRRAKTTPRAPVLLRSAVIEPTDSTLQDYALRLDPHVVLNPVLANYLRGEVGIDLDTATLANLSLGDGFDPRQTYRELERQCASMDGFGINPQVVLTTFPWSKLDLVARLSRDPAPLAGHDLIAALAGHAVDLAQPQQVTAEHDPQQELSVVDADAEQREVIAQVHRGASLVLDTPTGTGATQTVANIVADHLARGRTTLVVSEERAGLDAVRDRLARAGLEDVVLELTEDPRRGADVIAQLAAQVQRAADGDVPELAADPLPGWVEAQAVLAQHEAAMHAVHEPWGCTLAQTQSALAALAMVNRPPLSHVRLEPAVLTQMPRTRVSEVSAVLRRAASERAWERGRLEDPWYAATLRTTEEATRAAATVAGLVEGELTQAREQMAEVCRKAGLPEPLTLTQWAQRLELMARVHETLDHFRPQIYEAPLGDLIAAVSDRGSDVERPGAVARGRSKRAIRNLLRPGKPPADLAGKLSNARAERTEWEALAGKAARPHTPHGWETATEAYATIGPPIQWLQEVLADTSGGSDLLTTHLDLLLERFLRLDARADRAAHAARAFELLQPLRDQGLGPLVDDLAKRGIGEADVDAEVELVYQTSLLDHICAVQRERTPPTPRVVAAARQLRIADRDHLARNRMRARRSYARRLARAIAAHPGQVRTLTAAAAAGEHDLRSVITRIPDLVRAIRPVLLASPLIVPSVLPPTFSVDLVVIEHAGRARVSACIDALSRSSQALIVGDGLRHGPQEFSYLAASPPAPGDATATTPDGAGSLLSRAREVLPVRSFSTHYRAVDQRLIRPLTLRPERELHAFPGVWPAARAGRRLVPELDDVAATAAASVIDHLLRRPTRSLAVLTDTSVGAQRVWDHVRAAAVRNPALRTALSVEGTPGVWCGRVTAWSGAERDRCLWVRDTDAEVDPRDVATVLAAARRSVTVITVDSEAMAAAEVTGLVSEAPSKHPLVVDLVTRLRAEGLVVHSPVGAGRYAVPLGIEDPQRPGRLLVAVDLDLNPLPATPGRDDVRLRSDQLTKLGWSPTRVLSTNLFRDPAREVAALVRTVHQASQEGATTP